MGRFSLPNRLFRQKQKKTSKNEQKRVKNDPKKGPFCYGDDFNEREGERAMSEKASLEPYVVDEHYTSTMSWTPRKGTYIKKKFGARAGGRRIALKLTTKF